MGKRGKKQHGKIGCEHIGRDIERSTCICAYLMWNLWQIVLVTCFFPRHNSIVMLSGRSVRGAARQASVMVLRGLAKHRSRSKNFCPKQNRNETHTHKIVNLSIWFFRRFGFKIVALPLFSSYFLHCFGLCEFCFLTNHILRATTPCWLQRRVAAEEAAAALFG